MNLYEGMFLLDNNVVREDWTNAKEATTAILEKHGAQIATARRWAERSLAYTIKKRNRGTYLLVHFEADPDSISIVRRDLELNETVMRYLILRAEEVPEGEQELHEAELSSDFSVPEPPEDHVVDVDEEEEGAPREGSSERADVEKPAKAETTTTDGDKPAEAETTTTEGDKPAEAETTTAEGDKPAEGDVVAPEETATEETDTEEEATEEDKPAEADAPEKPATDSDEEQAEAKTSEEG